MPSTCCCVPECHNRGGHRFPSDSHRKAWIHAIRRGENCFKNWEPSDHSVVCKDHFNDDDYIAETVHGTVPLYRKLKKTAIPSKFGWKMEPSPQTLERKWRAQSRNVKRKLLDEAKVDTHLESQVEELNLMDMNFQINIAEEVEISETAVASTNISLLSDPETVEIKQTTDDSTQTPSFPMFSVEKFVKDDVGIHFYTGLETYARFQFVLQTLGSAINCLNYIGHQVENISVENQFFMVLMKLRRHTTNFELSRLFSISDNTVSNIIITWIKFIYLQWKELNIWPEKDLVHHFAPSDFKAKFPSTRLIIDGTECPIKKPRAPKAQQATFSTYKNRNTVKTLVGATPGGLVSYVSPAYGGSTSDRQIVERSTLCTDLDPRDSVMADKGFNVQDLFAPYDVTINIPSFFKKKNRLSNDTVLKDRKIASKRVHIERIIGLGKTFKILGEPMTSTETKLSTEIIFICFMLCNFRKCIVPKHA